MEFDTIRERLKIEKIGIDGFMNAKLNDYTIMTISKDHVKPFPMPDSCKLKEIFATWVILGTYLAVIFFWAMHETDFLSDKLGVRSIRNSRKEEMAALYLRSIVNQALIFVSRSQSWSYAERPGVMLISALIIAQLVATIIAVYANWAFADIKGCSWGWAGVIWLYSVVFNMPLDLLRFATRYILSMRAWDNLLENRTAFTTKEDYGKEEESLELGGLQGKSDILNSELARLEQDLSSNNGTLDAFGMYLYGIMLIRVTGVHGLNYRLYVQI